MTGRVFGLDIFRALAILLVVFSHGGFLLNNTFLEGFPYFRMLDGVDLFFVLSGFLIGHILLKEIGKTGRLSLGDLGRFWKRRWFRTLPNYYLVLLLNYLFVLWNFIPGDLNQFNWRFFFFLQNFSSPFVDFFWESWSLTVEEWFYIIAPLLLFALVRLFSPKISFLIVVIAMMVFPVFYRIYLHDAGTNDFWYDVTFRKIVLTRLDSIAYGLLAAWIFFYYGKIWKKAKIPAVVAGIALIVFLVNYESPNSGLFKQVIYFSLSPIAAMLLLPFAEGIKNGKGMVANAVVHVSKISYAMYLLNLALIAEVFQKHFLPHGTPDGIMKYVLYWTIVIVASTLLYKYFEKPIMDLRDGK